MNTGKRLIVAMSAAAPIATVLVTAAPAGAAKPEVRPQTHIADCVAAANSAAAGIAFPANVIAYPLFLSSACA